MKLRRLPAILCASVCLCSAAHAARAPFDMYLIGEKQTASFGGYIGSTLGGDVTEDSGVWGLQVDFHLNRLFSMEVAFGTFNDSLSDIPISDGSLRFDGDTNIETYFFAVTGNFSLPITRQFAVYGGGGLSYFGFDPDSATLNVDSGTLDSGFFVSTTETDVSISSEFGIQLEAGVKFAVNMNVELFAEYRATFMDRTVDFGGTVNTRREVVVVETPEGGGAGTESISVSDQSFSDSGSVDGSYNFGMWRVGVDFYF